MRRKKFSFTKHNTQIFSEAAWAQFLFILKFNLEDDSPGFEKTDVPLRNQSIRCLTFLITPL